MLGDDGTSERVISPLLVQGQYLVAYCHLRDDERTFRLDRIEADLVAGPELTSYQPSAVSRQPSAVSRQPSLQRKPQIEATDH